MQCCSRWGDRHADVEPAGRHRCRTPQRLVARHGASQHRHLCRYERSRRRHLHRAGTADYGHGRHHLHRFVAAAAATTTTTTASASRGRMQCCSRWGDRHADVEPAGRHRCRTPQRLVARHGASQHRHVCRYERSRRRQLHRAGMGEYGQGRHHLHRVILAASGGDGSTALSDDDSAGWIESGALAIRRRFHRYAERSPRCGRRS